jgi:hypothetical protein
MAFSPAEGIAVVRYPDRRLRTLRVGDVLGASSARLTQVLPDRLVLQEGSAAGGKQTVWLFRPRQPDAPAMLQRLNGAAPVTPGPADALIQVTPIKPASSTGGKPSSSN